MADPPPRRRNATIRDVARHVGVSPMTVSRVINATGRFSEATRQAVETAIRELGFARNPAARSLALARSVRIGVLYDKPGGAYLSELLIGLMEEAGRGGHQIMLQRCEDLAGADAAIARLLATGVDGVIVPPPFADEPAILEPLQAIGRPIVLIAGTPGQGMSTVRIDDRAAAHEMTRLLIARGYRRIGFVTGDERQAAARQRRQGYEDACRGTGLTPGPVATGDFSYRSGLDAGTQLIIHYPPPTAIFACNDDMAAAVVTAAHRQGLHLPRQLAVAGFDDTRIATTTWPELTTIHQPLTEMAQAATAILLRAIAAPDHVAEDVILPHRLVQRAST